MGTALVILVEIFVWGLVLLSIGALIEWVFSRLRRRRIDTLTE
jgi:hypothetical protein